MSRFAANFLKFALRQKAPHVLLCAGAVALAEAAVLYVCALHDNVLIIPRGVGLLQNFGLMSTLVGNAVIPYLAKLYCDEAASLQAADSIKRCPQVQASAAKAMELLELSTRARNLFLFFVLIGAAFSLSNASFHVLGMSELHWGHPVFDSVNHPASFIANRINNLYTWGLLLPICAHICVFNTYRIVAIMRAATAGRRAKFDPLNQDKCGGFGALDRSQAYLVGIFCVIYIQISFHTGTFRLNFEHISAYALTTALLIFGNTIFSRSAYASLKELRERAVNEYKRKSYSGDKNSLEILLYHYANNKRRFLAPDWVIKAASVLASVAIKGMPFYATLAKSI